MNIASRLSKLLDEAAPTSSVLDILADSSIEVKELLENYPDARYFSEWETKRGRQEYKPHFEIMGKMLYESCEKNENIPKGLVKVYTREQFEKLLENIIP